MQDPIVNTINIPAAGTPEPAPLYKAADRPMRLLVRNVGGPPLFLAYDPATLQNNAAAGLNGTFTLPADRSEVFVLAPRQGMYATADGGGGTASIAVSEAFPVSWGES